MFDKEQLLRNIREYLNTLNIIFYLMVGFPLIFFCIIFLKFKGQSGLVATSSENFNFFFHVFIPLTTIAVMVLAYRGYRKKRKSLKSEVPLQEKLLFFYQLSAKFYGFLFLANALPVIGLYLTGEQLFAGLYTVALVVFSLNRPTLHRIIKDLKLNENEKEKLIHSQNLHES